MHEIYYTWCEAGNSVDNSKGWGVRSKTREMSPQRASVMANRVGTVACPSEMMKARVSTKLVHLLDPKSMIHICLTGNRRPDNYLAHMISDLPDDADCLTTLRLFGQKFFLTSDENAPRDLEPRSNLPGDGALELAPLVEFVQRESRYQWALFCLNAFLRSPSDCRVLIAGSSSIIVNLIAIAAYCSPSHLRQKLTFSTFEPMGALRIQASIIGTTVHDAVEIRGENGYTALDTRKGAIASSMGAEVSYAARALQLLAANDLGNLNELVRLAEETQANTREELDMVRKFSEGSRVFPELSDSQMTLLVQSASWERLRSHCLKVHEAAFVGRFEKLILTAAEVTIHPAVPASVDPQGIRPQLNLTSGSQVGIYRLVRATVITAALKGDLKRLQTVLNSVCGLRRWFERERLMADVLGDLTSCEPMRDPPADISTRVFLLNQWFSIQREEKAKLWDALCKSWLRFGPSQIEAVLDSGLTPKLKQEAIRRLILNDTEGQSALTSRLIARLKDYLTQPEQRNLLGQLLEPDADLNYENARSYAIGFDCSRQCGDLLAELSLIFKSWRDRDLPKGWVLQVVRFLGKPDSAAKSYPKPFGSEPGRLLPKPGPQEPALDASPDKALTQFVLKHFYVMSKLPDHAQDLAPLLKEFVGGLSTLDLSERKVRDELRAALAARKFFDILDDPSRQMIRGVSAVMSFLDDEDVLAPELAAGCSLLNVGEHAALQKQLLAKHSHKFWALDNYQSLLTEVAAHCGLDPKEVRKAIVQAIADAAAEQRLNSLDANPIMRDALQSVKDRCEAQHRRERHSCYQEIGALLSSRQIRKLAKRATEVPALSGFLEVNPPPPPNRAVAWIKQHKVGLGSGCLILALLGALGMLFGPTLWKPLSKHLPHWIYSPPPKRGVSSKGVQNQGQTRPAEATLPPTSSTLSRSNATVLSDTNASRATGAVRLPPKLIREVSPSDTTNASVLRHETPHHP